MSLSYVWVLLSLEGLVTLIVGSKEWEGSWESYIGLDTLEYHLLSCLDTPHWNALLHSQNHQPLLSLSGTLSASLKSPTISGLCALPQEPIVDFELVGGSFKEEVLALGSVVNFVSGGMVDVFNVSVVDGTAGVLFEAFGVFPGSKLTWQSDASGPLTVFILYGDSLGILNFIAFGESLLVKFNDVGLEVSCTSAHHSLVKTFTATSSAVSTLCGDNSKLWVGGWNVEISPPLPYFGTLWYVCQSPTGGLVSSFTNAITIVSLGDYYVSEDVFIGFNELRGVIYRSRYPVDHGTFSFKLNPNKRTFSGFVYKDNDTYTVQGTLTSTDPYIHLCSPFQKYEGLWIESQYSSWMPLCVKGDTVYGSYFGGSIKVSGKIIFLGEWMLYFFAENTRTNHTEDFWLGVKTSITQQPMTVMEYGTVIFATPESRTVSDCHSIPPSWGIFSDDLFSSELYLCTGNGNKVYGNLNNGSYFFTGTAIDINVISGSIPVVGLSFTWILGYEKIYAEYKDENGVSFATTMFKLPGDVTLSQCNGFVLLSAYTGTWQMETGLPMYFCQVSETEVDGYMDTSSFSGVFNKGDHTLSGNYTNDFGVSGNWSAETDKEEYNIVIRMDGNPLKGTRYSRQSNPAECKAWKTFWKSSFGTSDLSHLLGGCFSVCFKEFQNEFNIIFLNSELYGNGTLDPSRGTLTGTLQNGWQFSIMVDFEKKVFVTVTDTSDITTTSPYRLCTSLPSNYSASLEAYPDCVPRRFEPTVHLPSAPMQSVYFGESPIRKGGVDITNDGKMAIVASGDSTFVMVNSDGTWVNQFQLVLPYPIEPMDNDNYETYGGTPVAITSTHAFVINGLNVAVFQNFTDKWEIIGQLDPPNPFSRPFYVIKSFSEEFSVLAVTWFGPAFEISLYNISNGEVTFSPFENLIIDGVVFSVAIDPSWLVYSTFDDNSLELKVSSCSLSPNGLSPCSSMKLATITNSNFGLGFSLAVNNKYLFVGYPSSQNNNGSVYVYKYNNHLWRLSKVLYPPDSGFHQSFGRAIMVRGNDLMILKGRDNTVKAFSMALFGYTLSSSKTWVPRFKLVSEGWPAFVPVPYQKRQYHILSFSPLESVLYWTMSNNGTLFTSTPSLDSFTQSWFSCPPGFWGHDCTLSCPCQSNSTCLNSILGYSCTCVTNTFGVNCEKICRDCHGAPCDDGAEGSGICLCNSSQFGPECLPCLCLNGDCSSGPNGTGLCYCKDGYSGTYCETKQMDMSTTIALSVVIPCAVLIFVGLLLFFLCRRNQTTFDISDLPEEIQWYFDSSRVQSEGGWTQEKGFLMKDVTLDKRYLKKLNSLMKVLEGSAIEWQHAHAIFNPTLQNNFLGFRSVTLSRHKDSPHLFKKKYKQNEKRDWVMEQYHNIVKQHPWNEELELPIVPVIHATDTPIAQSICSTGFAALSSLDAGFYGKGIYTTSSCLYALPYCAKKSKPALLVCLATPGHPFPVIENMNEPSGWGGKPVANGYQSHYVITAKNGRILQNIHDNFYDEFVLPTESQLLPIYLLSIQSSLLEEFLKEYQRIIK